MNSLLQEKLTQIKNLEVGECWYLVKQETSFIDLCYLVSFLQDYQESKIANQNLETYIKSKADNLNDSLPNDKKKITTTHRALRVAVFFGLISNSSKYEQAEITDVYIEIKSRCNGDFHQTELYKNIIQNQLEKMFISSDIDEKYNSTRKNYRLYPVMLLYKVLIELYLSDSHSKLSEFEYRYFVATTEMFEQFLDTLLIIQTLRNENNTSLIENNFKQYKDKVDNRLIQALKQLDTLDFSEAGFIKLNLDKFSEVFEKVHIFEKSPNKIATTDYSEFLATTQALIPKPTMANESGGTNILFYGVAGVGKSHSIKNIIGDDEHFIERIVFHPDYLNTDFVGQIMPTINTDGKIDYQFKAGSFTKILKKAIENPSEHFYLVIEEINRGNAPAIFGEIFQLLDRNTDGRSTYSISHDFIANNVFDNPSTHIYIPSNLTILATMNTADQNVFTLDTAFQRRWTMRMIENDITKCGYRDTIILDTSVTWEQFNKVINEFILESNKGTLSSEDKRLGAFFVRKDELTANDENGTPFAEKVIKYLWDDVFKFNKSVLFKSHFNSLDKVLRTFKGGDGNAKFDIFNDSISKKLKNE
ncbi:MAG: AAA family ATPase [Myroides sp.]|nr:AAA family ATPase [Myroides sp.]